MDRGIPPAGPPPAIFGARGQRPLFYPTNLTGSWLDGILEIPGVKHALRGNQFGLECTWDAAWSVTKLLRIDEPVLPTNESALPGLARYRELGLHEKTRKYQKEDLIWLTQRAWALHAGPMRSGKTLTALAADVLIDSRRTLVLGPSISLWNWAREIYMWTGERALILSGLGMRDGRLYCTACRGKGTVDGIDCESCKARNGQAYGYQIFDVPVMEPEILQLDDGPVCGIRGPFKCVKHPDLEVAKPWVLCPRCREELLCAIAGARYVVINYELLVPHLQFGGAGDLKGPRGDLMGWTGLLSQFPWDVAFCDESHLLRGWTTSLGRNGLTRREKTRELLARVQRVWMLSGTPFWGYTRDIWGQLDIASGGLFGEDSGGVPGKSFMLRYCGGKKGDFGWEASGRSAYAETELVRRLGVVMMKRTNEELFGQLPPETITVTVIEVDGDNGWDAGNDESKLEDNMARAIRKLSAKKLPVVLPVLLQELAQGNRTLVFCFSPESAIALSAAIEKEMGKAINKRRMQEVNAKLWLVTADKPSSPKARDEMAESFREHQGAGVFVSTIGVMQVAISLKGAASVHFVDLHFIPGAIFQAKDRAKDHTRPLSVVFYKAMGTIDERLEEIVLPRVEMLTRLANEKQADALRNALVSAQAKKETLDAIWARHTAHLRKPVAGLDDALEGEG